MTFDILVTTFKKTKSEIIELLTINNIFGNIYIGNQGAAEDTEEVIINKNQNIHIYNLTSVGVSKNRNFLLKKAKSDFVLFLDDDIKITNYDFPVEEFSLDKAYRFNLMSSNSKRPIKQIKKEGKKSFFDLKSFGAWGIFFPRVLLLEKNVLFNEAIGPGCKINHGEDSLFLKKFLMDNDIIQINRCNFTVSHTISTWQGEKRNINLELFSQGFVYGIMFESKAKLFLYYYLLKNHKLFNSLPILKSFKIAKKGLVFFRKTNNKDLTNDYIERYIVKEFGF